MTRLIPTIVALMVFLPTTASAESGDTGPQAVLDAYFEVLTQRNVEGISDLMASGSMDRLKGLMTEALQREKSRGSARLQNRFFGKSVTIAEIRDTPSSFYLDRIAGEILNAAEMQHFFVDNRRILGSVNESDDMVHIVVRLFLHQDTDDDTTYNSDIYVYTLIREDGIWKLEFPPTIRQALSMIEAGIR